MQKYKVRWKFNVNAYEDVKQTLKTLDENLLHKPVVASIMGDYYENQSLLSIYAHTVASKAYILLRIISLDGDLNDIINDQIQLMEIVRLNEQNIKDKNYDLEQIIKDSDYIDKQIGKMISYIDLSKETWKDFSNEDTAIMWLEYLFTHNVYHLGEIGHILGQEKLGSDLGRFSNIVINKV